MQARAHLKLIVSEAPQPAQEEPHQERVSMVQPVAFARLRRQRPDSHPKVLALWSASFVVLAMAVTVALGWH